MARRMAPRVWSWEISRPHAHSTQNLKTGTAVPLCAREMSTLYFYASAAVVHFKCPSNVTSRSNAHQMRTSPHQNQIHSVKSKSKCNQMEACISNAHQMWLVHQMRIKCTSHHTKIKCTSRNLNQSTIKCPSNTNQLQIKCMLKIKYKSSNQMPIKRPVAFDLPLMGIWLTFD